MIGLLGKKIGMTSIFNDQGRAIPVTVLEVGPCSVAQVKTKESDGYQAVQLMFEPVKESKATKAHIGHSKKHKVKPSRFCREIRTESIEGLEPGKELHANNFSVGDYVDVVGTSIGRGFQGVVKRHGFSGGEAAHGSKFGRQAGSTGQSATPARVQRGTKLPGQMGNKRRTAQNLIVEKIDLENHLVAIRGSIPGPKSGFVIVHEAVKNRRPRKWRAPDEGLEELKQPETKEPKAGAKKAAPAKKPAKKK
jgi:large subunit ribosomal protein L3